MIKKPTRENRECDEVEKGKAAATKDLMYRYPLYIDRTVMATYINMCKTRRRSANKELRAFIDRQLAAHAEKIE